MKYFFILIIILLSFSCNQYKILSTFIVKTEATIPETDKKFNISFKPEKVNKKKYSLQIYDEFKKYFGNNYTDDTGNSYKFEINFAAIGTQTIENQNNELENSVMINCPTKIYSPEGKLLLALNIFVRHEKKTDKTGGMNNIIQELANEVYNDYLENLNNNNNFLNFLKEENPQNKIIDDSTSLKEKNKPYADLVKRNKDEYRIFFSFNEEISGRANFKLNGTGYNINLLLNLCAEFYPIEYFSIEYKIDIYSLIIGNFLLNLNLFDNISAFAFYHELSLNTNFSFSPFFIPHINLYLGHLFQLINGSNYYFSYFRNDNTIFNVENQQSTFINALRIGLGLSFSLGNFYSSASNTLYGFSVFYSPYFSTYNTDIYSSVGFDIFIKSKFNFYIYREKPHKFVKPKNFRKF